MALDVLGGVVVVVACGVVVVEVEILLLCRAGMTGPEMGIRCEK